MSVETKRQLALRIVAKSIFDIATFTSKNLKEKEVLTPRKMMLEDYREEANRIGSQTFPKLGASEIITINYLISRASLQDESYKKLLSSYKESSNKKEKKEILKQMKKIIKNFQWTFLSGSGVPTSELHLSCFVVDGQPESCYN